MNLEALTANEAEAVKRYLEPSFHVVLKPICTKILSGTLFVSCNYCHNFCLPGTRFIHSDTCPEWEAKRPRRKEVAITRIFHMTAYAEVDEKGGLIIP